MSFVAGQGLHVRSRTGEIPAAPTLTTMPPADDLDPALALPAPDVRLLARRAAPATAAVAVAVAVLVLAGGPLRAFEDAFNQALAADPLWVGLALAFELLSFVGYVALLWLVGARATPRLGFVASLQVTLGGAAATRLLPTGGVGGAAVTIWFFRRAGLGPRAATRTLLAFLAVLYSVFLASIATAGGLLALGLVRGDGPLLLSAVPAAAAALAIAAALSLAARRPADDEAVAEPPLHASRAARMGNALRATPDVLGGAVRDALSLVRGADPRLFGALAWWGFDAAVLWAMLHALGAAPSLAVVALGYFVGQVANTIPLPGAVSGGMVGVLLAFGVQADLAISSVLAYRAVAIWLPAPLGVAALGSLRATVARWQQEDGTVAEAPGAPAGARPALPMRARRVPAPQPAG